MSNINLSKYIAGFFFLAITVGLAKFTWDQWNIQNTPCDDEDCDKPTISWTVGLAFTIVFGILSLVLLSRVYIDIKEYRKKCKSPYSKYNYHSHSRSQW